MNTVKPSDEMLEACRKALGHGSGLVDDIQLLTIATACCQHITDNPVVPTNDQAREMWDKWRQLQGLPTTNVGMEWAVFCSVEWQQRMFLKPQPLEERVTVQPWVLAPNLWIVLVDGWNCANVSGFKDKKDAEIFRLGMIETLRQEKTKETK